MKAMDVERFWSKVSIAMPHECWEWLGTRDYDGYGQFFWEGKNHRAHRIVKLLHEDMELSPDRIVMHTCDNSSCVNPAHLRVAQQCENVQDMINKKRNAQTGRKLNAQKAVAIRAHYAMGVNQSRLAAIHGVRRECINQVITGKTWNV